MITILFVLAIGENYQPNHHNEHDNREQIYSYIQVKYNANRYTHCSHQQLVHSQQRMELKGALQDIPLN